MAASHMDERWLGIMSQLSQSFKEKMLGLEQLQVRHRQTIHISIPCATTFMMHEASAIINLPYPLYFCARSGTRTTSP